MEDLPYEALFKIGLFLPIPDLLALCLASRRYYAIFQSFAFWRLRAQHDCDVNPEEFNQTESNGSQRYYQISRTLAYPGAEQYHHPNECLIRSIEQGQLHLIPYFAGRGVTPTGLNLAYRWSARHGHIEAMKRLDLLTPPPSDRYRPFLDAAESNKLDVILYLSSISPTNIIMINKALYAASHRCHHDIVKYLILQGATDLEQCLPNLIPSSSLQQIKEILQISNWIPDWDRCLRKAAGYSRLDQCQWFIEQGAEDLNLALEAAAGYGDVQTLEWLINHGASDLDTALYCAALEGNLEVVDYLLTAGATGVNSAIIQAAREGHLEIVQHLVSSGATELEEPFNEAVRKLHLDVIAYLARCRRSKMSREFLQAIEDGHQNLIRHLIRHQFIDPNEALVTATLSGDLELVVYLVSEGATHLHRPLKDATKYGLLPILRFLLHHLPPDADPKLNQLLQIAASRGYYDVVQYLVAYGTDTGCHDFTGVLAVAKDGSSLRLLRYLISIPEMEPEVETN